MLNVLVWGSVDSDRNSELVGLNIVELSNDEGEKIRRHLWRFVELDSLLVSLDLSLRSNIHVAQAGEVLVRDQSDCEFCLQCRFIETRESSSGISRFHLCCCQNTLGSIRILVC